MRDALGDVALLQLGEIETGREIIALAGEQHGADAVRDRGKESVEPDDGVVVQRVALLRTIEAQHGDIALHVRGERRRQCAREASWQWTGHAGTTALLQHQYQCGARYR